MAIILALFFLWKIYIFFAYYNLFIASGVVMSGVYGELFAWLAVIGLSIFLAFCLARSSGHQPEHEFGFGFLQIVVALVTALIYGFAVFMEAWMFATHYNFYVFLMVGFFRVLAFVLLILLVQQSILVGRRGYKTVIYFLLFSLFSAYIPEKMGLGVDGFGSVMMGVGASILFVLGTILGIIFVLVTKRTKRKIGLG